MKVAIVTGSSSGIGYALCNLLSKKGIKVYGISRTISENENVINISGDVTKADDIKKIFASIYEKEGRIDYLINNAGMGISGSVEATSLEDFESIFNVNLKGTFITSKEILPYMRKNNSGKIVNIGSVASEFSIPFQTFYSSSKAAIKAFSEALNNEVSPYGISVCTILPGDVKTNFTKSRKTNENELEAYEKRVSKSIGLMAKDEQNGMDVQYVSKVIYKTINKKRMPIQKTIGFKYKVFIFLKRFLPTKVVNKLVGAIYAFKKER
ncbi:SDR family NAD(P)-dependent oxidoreductase [Haploplasma axanthum]|uniref:Short chain dehydrogenase/reductase family oxidoreductase n=1 Tax=Haploplasma axanthum TaxID=29552 RepID=A0A449BCN3_HAPAX|nr:SDR family NAD(P)-dependent oxidoreductase [Haploplasma axanthum]VEU80203.1 short chain dehydrogenase/reductase family oxidoreductase [Haploplasma axanthum]